MHRVDWPSAFKQTAPFMSYTERNILLDVAGSYGISPVILLTASIYERHDKAHDFKEKIEDISGRLTQSYFTSSRWNNTKENIATYAIWIYVREDKLKLDQFLSIFRNVKAEVQEDLSEATRADAKSTAIHRIKRGMIDASEKTILRFPFPMTECWEIGPTHHSNKYCTTEYCPKSSLDLSPSLFHAFGHGFEYFGSEGEVVSAHGGEVFVVSSCKVMVRAHDLWTYYSHIKVTVTSGDRVRPGDRLGYIEQERSSANCNCEIR